MLFIHRVRMMMAPQVVGVLLKKPGQQNHPRVPSFDQQDTKIRGMILFIIHNIIIII